MSTDNRRPVEPDVSVLEPRTETVCSVAIIFGFVHVASSPVDLMNATLLPALMDGGVARSKRS